MRDYTKPYIEDENIELEDVIATSGVSNRGDGDLNDGSVGDSYSSDVIF